MVATGLARSLSCALPSCVARLRDDAAVMGSVDWNAVAGVAAAVGAVAAGVGAVFAGKTVRQANVMAAMARESAVSAQVAVRTETVRWYSSQGHNAPQTIHEEPCVAVVNLGPAVARNVVVRIDQHDGVPTVLAKSDDDVRADEIVVTVAAVAPGATIRRIASPTLNMPSDRVHVGLEWSDGRAARQVDAFVVEV